MGARTEEKSTRAGRSELTAGAVDQRVARAAEQAAQAGACRVAQQAVRPLSRAPLRAEACMLSLNSCSEQSSRTPWLECTAEQDLPRVQALGLRFACKCAHRKN